MQTAVKFNNIYYIEINVTINITKKIPFSHVIRLLLHMSVCHFSKQRKYR